jgi:hypothetical protein
VTKAHFHNKDLRGAADGPVDLRSPLALVRCLNLAPTATQRMILEKFPQIYDLETKYCENNEVARALALGMLWQILTVQGSQGVIISSRQEWGREIMSFLMAAIMRVPESAELFKATDWHTLQFGRDPGWKITYLSRPESFHGRSPLVALTIGEGSSEIEDIDKLYALLIQMRNPQRRILHLW